MSNKTYLKDYVAPNFCVKQINLFFDFQDDHVMVTNQFVVTKPFNHNDELTLNGEALELVEFSVNGVVRNDFFKDDSLLKINEINSNDEIKVVTKLYPAINKTFYGLFKSGNTFFTQCEAEGFRKITYFLDRPDVLTTYIVEIACKDPVLLSNGNLVEKHFDGERYYAKWHDPFPKPSYLFALVAGNLSKLSSTYKTSSGKEVQLELYTDFSDSKQLEFAMYAVKAAMKWDEVTYGLEYDLNLYMLVASQDFNMGAMENKGLNIFNLKYLLAHHEISTDEDFLNVLAVVGHEYFHNWSGNRVTCKNWFQLSLKEGFTVFREQQFMKDTVKSQFLILNNIELILSRQFVEDSSPLSHAVIPDSYLKIDNFYTMTIYEKGAEIIRMIYNYMGHNKFIKGCQEYFKKFDGQAVAIEDFIDCLAAIDPTKNIKSFLVWYYEKGTPEVNFAISQLAGKNSIINVMFEQKYSKVIPIPINFKIYDENNTTVYANSEFLLDEKNKTIEITGITNNNLVPAINRQFSAPIKINYQYSLENLIKLITIDDDAYIKYECMNNLWFKYFNQEINLDVIIDVYETVIDQNIDEGVKAKIIDIPNLTIIFEKNLQIYSSLDKAFDLYKQALRSLSSRFTELFMNVLSSSEHVLFECEFTKMDIPKRKILAVFIKYLSITPNDTVVNYLVTLYSKSKNFNLKYKIISGASLSLRDDYFEKLSRMFLHDYSNNKLLLNKYFLTLASRIFSDPLIQIKNEMLSSRFDITNPNHVYSLIDTFCKNNIFNFNHKNGSGYELLHDVILKLYKTNTSVAANLCRNFSIFNKVPEDNKVILNRHINSLLNMKGLTNDLREILINIK